VIHLVRAPLRGVGLGPCRVYDAEGKSGASEGELGIHAEGQRVDAAAQPRLSHSGHRCGRCAHGIDAKPVISLRGVVRVDRSLLCVRDPARPLLAHDRSHGPMGPLRSTS
jgi:hypothetical protein